MVKGLYNLEDDFIPSVAVELRQTKEFMRRTNNLTKLLGVSEKTLS